MRYGFRLVLAAGVLAASMQLSAEDEISLSLSVTPSVATANGNARLRVVVERNDMNRALIWEVDGPNYYRSSAMEMDGAASPRSYFFVVRDLPAGHFEVRVTVRRNDNSMAVDRDSLRVVGGPE